MPDPLDLNRSGIRTILLGVANLETALAFYRDRLGLPVQFSIPGFAFLSAGPLTLGLSEPVARGYGAAPGAVELVFSVEDVKSAYATLKERGVTFKNEPRQVTPKEWAANFDDPDGHHLSIFGPPGA